MARIPRKTQKIFASAASNNGVFGSAADNTKILSNDITVIQSKPAYDEGWLEAVIGTKKFPTLEEMQAIQYMVTTQISYLFQEGIAEYDSGTTYYQNSIVKKSGTYEIYGSITDDNVGNPLTDDTNWVFLQDLSATVGDATTSVKGIAMLATLADVRANNATKIVTPNLLSECGFITGDFKGTTRETAQNGWVFACGTIGDASSNATNRANTDTEELFKYYWNATAYNYVGVNASGAALQVYDSAGVAVAKGVSAAADWAAHRQISVVDMRDRVPAGRGNMIGNAGRLSGQPGGVNGNGLGNSGGAESHSLQGVENGPHDHTFTYLQATPTDQPGSAIRDVIRPGQGGSSTFTVNSSGGGDPHNNVQPTIICNFLIKL